MKQTVNLSDFRDAFKARGRGDQFSYAGLAALYDYMVTIEEDTGVEFELDVIAICCEFQEMTLDEVREQYDDAAGLDDAEVIEWLQDHTAVIEVDSDRVIIQAF